jgi:hypothetical protein
VATAPEQTPWPFLVVLMSSSPSGERPRVRGLGFVHGDVIVTLAHIAESADIADLATEDSTRAVRPLTVVENGLALMALSTTPTTPVRVDLGPAKGPVAVAIVSDISPSIQRVPGHVDEPDPDERFTVTLHERLGEDYTVSGSPVVAGGTVVGIAGPTATSGSVDAFGVAEITRLLEHVPTKPSSGHFSQATLRALGNALEIAGAAGPAAAVLLGVLRSAGGDARQTVPAQLLSRIDPERLGATYARFSGPITRKAVPVDASAMTPDELQRSAIAAMLGAAEVIRARVGFGDDRLHRRHLLAAVVVEPPHVFPDGFFDELGLSHAELRRALHEVIASTYDPHDAWDLVFAEPPAPYDLAGGHDADLVDPTTGIPLSRDRLGLGVDVTMFAALIADTKTKMPLSVGLFGEWGSGKSYFMALLRAEIARLSRSNDRRYRSRIVQIGFNAWHYADSNLWASLGDEIFEQLAGPKSEQSTTEQRKALREALDDRLLQRAELKAAAARAEQETARLTGELATATANRRTSARDLATAVLNTQALQDEVRPALDKLGVTGADERLRLLTEELEGAPADAAVVGRAPRWAVAAVAAIAVALVAAGIVASHALAGVGAAVVTVAGAVAWIAARIRSGARLLHQVADNLRHGQREAVKPQLTALRQAETNERMFQTQLEEVNAHVGELRRELVELTPGQRLYRFVAERAASDAYSAQLGLISTIRKDFEQLNALMKDWRKNGARDEDPERAIDRIVLYIDDLDRCSPEQVVEVLQAVHLLLAIDLFVVVVGVDPRWLLRSLRHEYRTLLTVEAQDPRWQSTPQDYLEKIFNIPFALPRMTATSFGQLVGSFVETEDGTHEPPPGQRRETKAEMPGDVEFPARTVEEPAHTEVEKGSEVAQLRKDEPKIERRPLTADELDMLTALAPLVETPREAKRLANLYRMMRSTRDLSPAARFLGDEAAPGEYQAVVILLGLLSGHARLLHDVLVAPVSATAKGGLRDRPHTETWAQFVAGITPRDGRNDIVGKIPPDDLDEWERLAAGLEDASALVRIPDLRPFQAWAPRIARFSFLLSPYAEEVRGDESRASATLDGT